jgi:hypothetical protein
MVPIAGTVARPSRLPPQRLAGSVTRAFAAPARDPTRGAGASPLKSSLPLLALLTTSLATCVSPDEPAVVAGGPVAGDSPALAQQGRVLERKVAVARFTSETQYGRGVFGGGTDSPIEEQAADTLETRLADTGRVVRIDVEGYQPGATPAAGIPADDVIVGSVSRFGRKTSSETGVFSRTKTQTAQAAVDLRLIRTSTGEVIDSEEGSARPSAWAPAPTTTRRATTRSSRPRSARWSATSSGTCWTTPGAPGSSSSTARTS